LFNHLANLFSSGSEIIIFVLSANAAYANNNSSSSNDNKKLHELYRLLPIVCTISYGYDCQDNNKAEYLTGETKTDIDMSYLFNISIDFLLYFSTYDLGNHQVPPVICNPIY
jgi:hypothetical protein